ncbi:MAG: 3,4-dihydroxy-2-butanone-4-phosphate synthase [Deltaproteobacteria bacterium]|nr:3,4-dihydroxy-2-butanone-4-phosphate synthase [Deltaproteobacteria bacterium]MBW1874730.1 3,4-dihydroxy-2-butanone-4-phosphate synthase [Deltaproteobacteria bacterium]MBW2212983.1 3,4-dihydroxy-2-butanone-4-phosphate synthase [Deltaproteobacteria bacterium]MBW2550419.1 3,4-dihydroxy-2-butanone-4-phosphate synthase [Deltaproteobacteria bacterium]MBW2627331.1 3,4-dihydroxy-2-butanone-4-phosphate synthase [Deltaproteobacteria bacterium]
MASAIERVDAALDDIRKGKMVILVDDEDRENEGDVCMAAEMATPETINFMARHARGLICLSLTEERIRQLDLPMMVDDNRSSRSTAFTISIEARTGVTTGISAGDRAQTIVTAVADETGPADLVSPGHVFPLKAVPGGVLQRTGHTEGSADLARLAGLKPASVICEIMKDDGTMARYPDLVAFAEEHGLLLLTIADLIQYRLARERLVARVRRTPVDMPTGCTWTASVYRVQVGSQEQFMALSLGEITSAPTLVRVHRGSVLGDAFQVRMGDRVHLADCIAAIERAGNGVILFMPGHPDPETDLAFYLDEPITRPPEEPGVVLREYGFGAQVLSDLGLEQIRVLTNRPRRIPSLDAYGLNVVEQLLVSPGGEMSPPPAQQPKATT